MVKQISDNEIYLLIKYIKSVVWREAKRQSYTEDAQSLKVKRTSIRSIHSGYICVQVLVQKQIGTNQRARRRERFADSGLHGVILRPEHRNVESVVQ